TSCTLPGFLSSTRLPVTTVVRDFDFDDAAAAYPCGPISKMATAVAENANLQTRPRIHPPRSERNLFPCSLTAIDRDGDLVNESGRQLASAADEMVRIRWRKF